MKKISSRFVAVTVLAFAATSVMAQSPLTGVAGYDPAEQGGGELIPSALNGNLYTITMNGVIGVAFNDLKGLTPMKKAMDVPTKKQVGLYNLPVGTTIYAMGLGREWGEMSEELMQIDVTKAKASGKIGDIKDANGKPMMGVVALSFTKGEERCRTATWVAELPDGQRAWASHPGDGWSTKNVNGSPMTGWCFKGNEITKLDANIKLALAKKK